MSYPQSALKIGFELAGDLGKLSSSYPRMAAFTHVESVLDLRHLWVASLEHKFGPNSVVSDRRLAGRLSTSCGYVMIPYGDSLSV